MLKGSGPSGEFRNGHKCFTNNETAFYTKEYIEKANRIEMARMSGQIVYPNRRNPILGEKSARKDYKDWDFKPPEVESAKTHRLDNGQEYPLIANFKTQKQKFIDEAEKRQQLKQTIQDFYQSNKNSDNEIKNESNNTSRSHQMNTTRSQQNDEQYTSRTNQSNINNTSMSTSRTNQSNSTSRLDTIGEDCQTTARKPHLNLNPTLTDMKVSTFKSLAEDHPEILAKYRAERAAKFVTNEQGKEIKKTYGNFQSAPLSNRSSSSRNRCSTALETSRMKEQLDVITHELEKTNEQIARQQLKIGLKSKKYGNANTENCRNKSMVATETRAIKIINWADSRDENDENKDGMEYQTQQKVLEQFLSDEV
eukprot:gene8614-17775_t